MRPNNALASVLDMLLKPVPYLPEASFLSARPPSREEVKRRLYKKKGKRMQSGEDVSYDNAEQHTIKGAIARGSQTPYSIAGQDISLDSDTWIFGEVRVGSEATVIGLRMNNITYAKKIIISA